MTSQSELTGDAGPAFQNCYPETQTRVSTLNTQLRQKTFYIEKNHGRKTKTRETTEFSAVLIRYHNVVFEERMSPCHKGRKTPGRAPTAQGQGEEVVGRHQRA